MDGMRRGDLVTIALQGDFGKPRPALVVQADVFGELESVTVLPVTSTPVDAPLLRIAVEPGEASGLSKPSQVMVDKAVTVRREKVGEVIGHLDVNRMAEVDRCLALFLGIAR